MHLCVHASTSFSVFISISTTGVCCTALCNN
nr:MAG TPA_asm: hypothetical protein [Caudoviricetes sp.]